MARINIYVDDHLVRENLLAQTRRNSILMLFILLIFIAIIIFLFGYVAIDRTIDAWIESVI